MRYAFMLGSGQGKTIIALLIAAHYKKRERRVTIVVPTKQLKIQLESELYKLVKDFEDIEVVTPKLMSKASRDMDVCIVDEADLLLEEQLFIFREKDNEMYMNGLYRAFRAKSLIFMSARFSEQLKRFL